MTAPDQLDLPVGGRRRTEPDWTFLTRPRWILSHLFAGAMILVFLVAMMWQVDRRSQRIELNELIQARAQGPAYEFDIPMGWDEANYQRVAFDGEWVTPALVRVSNRSLDGVAGQWVVGEFRTEFGWSILVNRGFVPLNAEVPPIGGSMRLEGFLRDSVKQDGVLSVADSGEGDLVNRLNVDDIYRRIEARDAQVPVWLQLESATRADGSNAIDSLQPQLVPLPQLDNGPHFSYAVQWAVFAILGLVVYGLLLRRIATTAGR